MKEFQHEIDNRLTTVGELERLTIYGDRPMEASGRIAKVVYTLGHKTTYLCSASFERLPWMNSDHILYQNETDAVARSIEPDVAKAFMRAIHYDFDVNGPRDGDAWHEIGRHENMTSRLYSATGYEPVEETASGLLYVRRNTQ